MYKLFLETKASKQIDAFAKDKGIDAEDIKKHYYEQITDWTDNDWIAECLDGNAHTAYGISGLLRWKDTAEGHEYWSIINDY
jgi:hypothetical protein